LASNTNISAKGQLVKGKNCDVFTAVSIFV